MAPGQSIARRLTRAAAPVKLAQGGRVPDAGADASYTIQLSGDDSGDRRHRDHERSIRGEGPRGATARRPGAGLLALRWFLPVLGDYSGWDAFLAALRGPFLESAPTRGDDAIAQLLSALTNVGFVVLFVVSPRRHHAALAVPEAGPALPVDGSVLAGGSVARRRSREPADRLLRVAGGIRAAGRARHDQRRFSPSNIENTHGRHASMSATLRFSRLGR